MKKQTTTLLLKVEMPDGYDPAYSTIAATQGSGKWITLPVTEVRDLDQLIQQAISSHEAGKWMKYPENKPEEGGRYWCLIAEQNDLGKSYFQWNCSYHEIEKRWSDNFIDYNVIYWTNLLPLPAPFQEGGE